MTYLPKTNIDKIRVIYNPISSEFKYTPKEFNSNKPRILHIGTLPHKNLKGHIKALCGLSCHLVIIGHVGKDDIEQLESNVISYEIKSNLSNNEIIREYQNCDILLFASKYEGFGLPIIEAQSIGRPVITSNIAPMNEIGENSTYLVDPNSTPSIRYALEELIAKPALRKYLVTKGLENSALFSEEKIAGDYAKLYKEVLGE